MGVGGGRGAGGGQWSFALYQRHVRVVGRSYATERRAVAAAEPRPSRSEPVTAHNWDEDWKHDGGRRQDPRRADSHEPTKKNIISKTRTITFVLTSFAANRCISTPSSTVSTGCRSPQCSLQKKNDKERREVERRVFFSDPISKLMRCQNI